MSGETRHFWLALPTIYKYAVKPNNADVFVYISPNSCCNYIGTKKRFIDEESIFVHCLKDHLKEFHVPDAAFTQERDHLVRRYIQRIKDYISPATTIWYQNDDNKAFYLMDEWLKVRECAKLINGYDIVVRIRPDISWQKSMKFARCKHGFYINYDVKKCMWAKDYLYAGPEELVKRVSMEFVDYLGSNLTPCADADNDLTLGNEIQFGKYLTDNEIPCRQLKRRKRDISRKNIHLTGNEPYYYVYNGTDNIVNNYVEG